MNNELKIAPNDKKDFYNQFDTFYSKPFPSCEEMEKELRALTAGIPDCFDKRAVSYKYLAEKLEIGILTKCPFAFHYNNRRNRADLEMTGISNWYNRLDEAIETAQEFYKNIADNYSNGLAAYYLPVDNCHLTINYEKVLKIGLNGILKEAEHFTDGSPFYNAVKCGLEAYIRLAERFSILAADKIERLSEAMAHSPAEPARNFYEALNTIVFLYFTVPALDGGTVSVFGHVDKLLCAYLQNDLECGAITYEEAFDLIWRFIYIIDSRWTVNHKGTNCTITVGGCDENGGCVFNGVTELIIKAYRELRCIDPKLNIRLSKDAPRELITLVAEAISDGLNNICVFNDDVIIEANRRMGKEIRDCRSYVGGGCQENVLANCEMNSRATIYMNTLPALFSGWRDESWNNFTNKFSGGDFQYFNENDNFEDIYNKTIHNLKVHVTAQVNMKNITEAKGLSWCASPAHSALLDNCVEKGVDMYMGGAKYSYGSVSLVGIGTLIDSLLAIKWVVFDQKLMSLNDFVSVVKNNYKGYEQLRMRIIKHSPKFMRDPEADDFAAILFKDAAKVSCDLKNTRGGKYEASLFSFRSFISLGSCFPSTPDGRLSGEYLSAGMSPSIYSQASAIDMLNGLGKIDLTNYPVVAVLDVKLPLIQPNVTESLIIQFIKSGGSVLQMNIVDQQMLIDAKAHPENYENLIVRMSGFSARFVALSESEKDEVINRTVN